MNKKLTQLIFFLLFSCLGVSYSSAANYQDWWWNPEQDGMGFNIGQQNNTLIVVWYLYDSNRRPSFLMLEGELQNNELTGSLVRSNGPLPGPRFDPSQVTRSEVGTATIKFNSDRDATFSYEYDNRVGSIALQRFSYRTLPITGHWFAAQKRTLTGCTNPDNNEQDDTEDLYLHIAQLSPSTYRIGFLDEGESCETVLILNQSGSTLYGNGTLVCMNGWIGDIYLNRVQVTGNDSLFIDYTTNFTAGEKCTEKGRIVGMPK